MAHHVKITTLVVGVLLGVGCGAGPTAAPPLPQVTERDGLLLDLDMERLLLAIGDSSTVTMRLSNVNTVPVRLEFGSTCQISPYIETTAGAVRVPGGGSWICGAAITSLVVPANGVVTRTLVVRAVESAAGLQGAVLTPGTYRAYALVETPIRGQQLRSRAIEFEVR
jgi:hypothetical protein